jgi:hypothetical protein
MTIMHFFLNGYHYAIVRSRIILMDPFPDLNVALDSGAIDHVCYSS